MSISATPVGFLESTVGFPARIYSHNTAALSRTVIQGFSEERMNQLRHDEENVVGHGRLVVIECHELSVSLEAGVFRLCIRAGAVGPGQLKPSSELGLRSLLQDLDEGGIGASDMVEDAVEEHAQTPCMSRLDQGDEIRIVAEPRIDREWSIVP
ncbi:hypothetical protein AFCDBAGC_5113 [Methylobacterium cerastii]|uniref:Uncharacterized protein n=1 Tax=Methylobacterium cerastii TaxID=932741 RepID=A0ABQ4QPJ5_9HYPH|nr:hypothetical protein AFCDBAGC_5113 [Methylobacterium cerastii]